MTKLELMNQNKKHYANLKKSINNMTGLEKRVAETMTLAWLKGARWMGGLADSKSSAYIQVLTAEGYELDDICNEFSRQMDLYL